MSKIGRAKKRHQKKLQTRSAVSDDQELDINTRASAAFSSSYDEQTRTIQVTLATEEPTRVYDFQRRELVEEVLLARGLVSVDEIPLLDNHNRFDNDAVFGIINNIRSGNGDVSARVRFADMKEHLEKYSDDEAARKLERTVSKVKQGVLRGISAGYHVEESVYIAPGEQRVVGGKTYKARSNIGMSIVTRWLPREGSITPVQADRFSTTRSDLKGVSTMPPKLRQNLVALGLRSDSTDSEAWAFYHQLEDSQRSEFDDLTEGIEIPSVESVRSDDGGGQQTSQPAQQSQRSAQQPQTPETPAADTPATVTDDQIRSIAADQIRQGQQAERERVRELNDLFGNHEPELRNRAIAEGWDYNRASRELVPRLRSGFSPAVGGDMNGGAAGAGNLGIHSRGSGDLDDDVLSAALMMRDVNMEHDIFRNPEFQDRIDVRSLHGDINSDARQQTLERANRIRRMSAVDVCAQALRNRNITDFNSHDPESIVQRALSSGAVTNIFSTNVSARLLIAYADSPDTTEGWCSEEDVVNFQTNERTGMGKFKGLKKHSRGGTAEDNYIDDEKEEYKIARYSSKFVIDEQDFLDDNLNGLDQVAPSDMGMAAAQLRPDLVYAMILSNPSMRDSVALFNAAHSNYRTGAGTALSISALESAEIAFGKQKIGSRTLNLSIRYLIGPRDLKWKAKQILNSTERRESASADGVSNPLSSEDIITRFDNRLGAAGVYDPDTETTQTGSATNYLLVAMPGEGGARTIVVGYRRGTGRAPRIRSFVLDRGQWGMGWDISHDIGVKALDWRAMQWNTGA